jgi:mevalonate kinase
MSERVLTKILVYDLPSENFKALENTPEKDKVRNVRVQCVQKLHSLGLQCTESVILVTPSRLSRVNEVIERVFRKYEELKREISHIIPQNNFNPIIRVLDLTQDQQQTFILLAKRRLMERIDESIERINEIIIAIDEITQEERRRALRYRLNQLAKEWNTVLEASQELGIDVSRDLEYLLDLIDNAKGRLE